MSPLGALIWKKLSSSSTLFAGPAAERESPRALAASLFLMEFPLVVAGLS